MKKIKGILMEMRQDNIDTKKKNIPNPVSPTQNPFPLSFDWGRQAQTPHIIKIKAMFSLA